jgi:hypothetical protein
MRAGNTNIEINIDTRLDAKIVVIFSYQTSSTGCPISWVPQCGGNLQCINKNMFTRTRSSE